MIADSAIDQGSVGKPLKRGVSVVVPVFNSEPTLSDLVLQVTEVLEAQGMVFEILLVNDGSRDGSWQAIESLVEKHFRVRGVNLSRNFGQHNATLCGLRQARYSVCVTLDDDLQHLPSDIPTLLRELDKGWDVVYGVAKKKQHSWARNVLSTLTKSVVGRATGLRRVATQSPFRAIRTELRSAFDGYMGPDLLLDVLLGWGTTKFGSVPVKYQRRRRGSSNYSAKRLFEMGLLTLTAYSTTPLRIVSWLGFTLTLFGIAVFGYVVVLAVFFGSVPGFPFLASLISIFSGAQLFALGLFGEYLTRVFNRALGRPTYVIRETTSSEAIGR